MYLEDWIVWAVLFAWLVVLPACIWVAVGRYFKKRGY